MDWLRRLPKLSLILLWLTYGVFGWYWATIVIAPLEQPWGQGALWCVLTGGILLLAGIMTAPLANVRRWVLWWLGSDTRSFITTIVLSFLGVSLVLHMSLVANVLILLSAMTLARLDLQTQNFGEWTAFWILGGLGLGGLALGGCSYWLWNQATQLGAALLGIWG
jgi:hypothetical protein